MQVAPLRGEAFGGPDGPSKVQALVRKALSTGVTRTVLVPAPDVDVGWLEVKLAGWEATAGLWRGRRKRLAAGL